MRAGEEGDLKRDKQTVCTFLLLGFRFSSRFRFQIPMPVIPQKKEDEAVDWTGLSPPAGAFHYLMSPLSGSKGTEVRRERQEVGPGGE